jgi:hypothetical protein
MDLKRDAGIDLENIVYYKDDTHYFVMTAKKQSLIQRGVVIEVRPTIKFVKEDCLTESFFLFIKRISLM